MAIRDAQRGAKLYHRDRHHRLAAMFGGHDPGVCAGSVGGISQVTAGRIEAGIRTIVDSIALADALQHPHSMAHALMNGLTAASAARDYEHLRNWGTGLSALAETYNFPLQRAVADFLLEWGKAQSGDVDQDRLCSTFNSLVNIGPFTLLYTGLFAEELLKAGQTGEALSVIDDFVGTLKSSSFGICLPEIYRVRGECLAALGREEEAIDQLRHAAEVAAEQGSELFVLRAAVARARCCMSRGDEDSAVENIERSLATIGASDWPEIVAARGYVVRPSKKASSLNRMSMQSAGQPTG